MESAEKAPSSTHSRLPSQYTPQEHSPSAHPSHLSWRGEDVWKQSYWSLSTGFPENNDCRLEAPGSMCPLGSRTCTWWRKAIVKELCSARDPRTWFRCMWVEMKGRLSPAASNHNDLIMIIIDFRKQDVELVKKTLYVCADVRFLTKWKFQQKFTETLPIHHIHLCQDLEFAKEYWHYLIVAGIYGVRVNC